MSKGFKIDHSIYKKSCTKGFPMLDDKIHYLVKLFLEAGSGVYIMYTQDRAALGHFWTVRVTDGRAVVYSEDPPRGIAAFKVLIHKVCWIRKCSPLTTNASVKSWFGLQVSFLSVTCRIWLEHREAWSTLVFALPGVGLKTSMPFKSLHDGTDIVLKVNDKPFSTEISRIFVSKQNIEQIS